MAPTRTCSVAFDAIKPEHAIAESDPATLAAVNACEYARIETLAGFVCDVDVAQHPPGGPSIDNQLYGVRVPTMTAMLDAEFYGDDLATQFQHERQAGGSRQKSPELCHTLLEEYPNALAAREIALRRLGASGRY